MTTTIMTYNYLRALAMLVAALAVLTAASLLASKPAHADDFTVTNTQDPGDGFCNASCTLREAIIAAGVNSGADTIKFNIPGSGVKTIRPTQELPPIFDNNDAGTTIDGYSQPGSVVNSSAVGTNAQPLIQLDGSLAGDGATGLRISGSNVTIRGLVINDFDGNGILTGYNSSNDSENVSLQGNFIGTDASGTVDLGNGLAGVVDLGDGHSTVGGTGLDDRNLISGNGEDGVLLSSDASLIQGNLIGLKKDGLSGLGNSRDGVRVASGEGNKIRQNLISSNGSLGIDLSGDGPTANDAGDADSGANELQNKPVIKFAKTGAAGTTIRAALNSVPNRTFLIEFFSNPSTDRAEGKKLIGEKSVTTGSDGNVTFNFKPQAKVPRGQFVTTTATGRPEFFDVLTETSEFSAPKKVVRP